MGRQAPVRLILLSVIAESCYLDSNTQPKTTQALSAALRDNRPGAGQDMRQGEHAAHTASLTRVGGLFPGPRNDGSGVASARQAASTAAPSSAGAPALRVTRLARSGSAGP